MRENKDNPQQTVKQRNLLYCSAFEPV